MNPFAIFGVVLVLFVATVQSYGVILSQTMDLEGKNNSIFYMDPSNGNFIKKSPWPLFQYTDSALDLNHRYYYLVGNLEVVTVNADGFNILQRVPLSFQPTDIAYDSTQDKLFAVVQSDHNYIDQIDLQTGRYKKVLQFDDYIGVFEGNLAFDSKHGYYFVQGQNMTGSGLKDRKLKHAKHSGSVAPSTLYIFDVRQGKLVSEFDLPDVIDGIQYDPIGNQLVGLYNDSVVLIHLDDIKHPKLEKINIPPLGILELFASAMDTATQQFFFVVTNFGANSFAWVDVKNRKLVTRYRVYDDFTLMQYLPPK